MKPHTEFGKWLRAERRRQGVSIKSLAQAVERSNTFMGQIERGGVLPGEDTAVAIAEALGHDPEEVLFMARGWPETLRDLKEKFPKVSRRYIV